MPFLNTSSIRMHLDPKHYNSWAVTMYDRAMKVINGQPLPELSPEDFASYGITSLAELNSYLSKKAQYGGYIKTELSEEKIIIPFHNDFMNSWLKFHNPRVIEFYNRLYESRKRSYQSREHFDRKRFDIEEEFQLNNWTMPKLDRRLLDAPICGCWDKPELIARFLELHGFQTRRLCCHDGNEMRGHCFAVYFDGIYWHTTSTRFPLNYKSKDYQHFCDRVFSAVRNIPFFSSPSDCCLIEYSTPVAGATAVELVDSIKNGVIICHQKSGRLP